MIGTKEETIHENNDLLYNQLALITISSSRRCETTDNYYGKSHGYQNPVRVNHQLRIRVRRAKGTYHTTQAKASKEFS